MIGKQWKKVWENAFQMVFFGFLSYLFALIKFTIPGVEGAASNLAEIPLLIALFHIKNPIPLIGMSFIMSIATDTAASFYTTVIMHVVSLIISWYIYSYIRKSRRLNIVISGIWFLYVFIYYMVLLLPLMILNNYFFGLNLDKPFFSFYKELIWATRIEWITTPIITALYLLQHKLRISLKNHKENLEKTVQNRTKDLYDTVEELKVAQNQLIQSEKMASLGTLTAGVAHEINNPLNYIAGGISMLESVKEKTPMNQDVESQKIFNLGIGMISDGLNKISDIVKALMTFSYGGTPQLVESDLQEIIENTILFLKHKMPNDITIEKHYSLHSKVPVFAEKIHQVLIYIIDNAIYEMNLDNTKPKVLSFSTLETENYAVITIANNGNKIPDNQLYKIFDPFYTTKDPGLGIGLGLSICYTLITEHNGKITAENTDTGVSFKIELPLLS